jgi:hypothetical protein
VPFHPESFLTEQGEKLLANFLKNGNLLHPMSTHRVSSFSGGCDGERRSFPP